MRKISWWLTVSVGLGILLNPLNSSMISVAIPRLQDVFHINFTKVSWVIFSFYIASAVAQPVMGKASDLFGRKKIFLTGLLVSFVVSLAAPLSSSFEWLIVFRILQSIGTSMMIAVGMAIVRVQISDKQGAALSLLSIFLSGAAAVGPFIGGILIYWWNWQAIFLINCPIVVVSFLLSWRLIPADESSASSGSRLSVPQWLRMIDVPGILLFAFGLVTILVGWLSFKSNGHFSWIHALGILTVLMLLLVFIRHELRTPSPFIPLRTFANYPAMKWIHIGFMLVNILYYSLFFGLPSYLQMVRHVSEVDTGMLMLSLGISSLLTSPLAGYWIDRSGPRPVLFLSSVFMTIGSVYITTLHSSSSLVSVCVPLIAYGMSNGLNSVGMQAALFQSSPKQLIGVASGLFNSSRYLGTILSSLLISIVMGREFNIEGFRILGIILTMISIMLVVISRYGIRLDVSQEN
ncbi:MFS transporter [Paenibacillus sp. JX-17]|uniref:MFS transporter n=1 Tax=Paenibacillus lacisoli TaxID=3064525 RepID=A0ABT9CF88_9BACL|nr:MFS transporter [Paenibacillus sp. JX-17]MDO7907941.1 MFS transporter [Paenibacillus sp. JX-17]